MRKLKTSDKMEFRHVVEELRKPIDYFYYIEDVIGALARFICYEQQFNEDIDSKEDDDVVDKKSNENAKKFLKEQLNEIMGINKLHHTIVKRQSKRVNAEHTKQYGEFIHYLFKAYDKEIEIKDIVKFIIDSTVDVPESIEDEDEREPTDLVKIIKKKEDFEEYLRSREGKLKGVYSRYIKDIEKASSEEVELDIFRKSSKISSSTKKICEVIDELKYLNSILKVKCDYRSDASPEVEGGGGIDPRIASSAADPIMKLLVKLFGN